MWHVINSNNYNNNTSFRVIISPILIYLLQNYTLFDIVLFDKFFPRTNKFLLINSVLTSDKSRSLQYQIIFVDMPQCLVVLIKITLRIKNSPHFLNKLN